MLPQTVNSMPTLFEDKISFEDLKPRPLKLSGEIGNACNQDLNLLKLSGIQGLNLNDRDKITLTV